MRSQIGICVVSLGNSIKEACCFVCGFTVFAQSNIYIICFEATQNRVRKRAKQIVFCLSRMKHISLCFDLERSNTGI